MTKCHLAVLVGVAASACLLASCTRAASAAEAGMVFVRGGSFLMGSPEGEAGRRDSERIHRVEISAFWLAARELSFAEYDAFCAATGRAAPDDAGFGRGERPAINVSWLDAVAYCNWRSRRDGLKPCYRGEGPNPAWVRGAKGYRLPTEAEWEYACRAGTVSAYSCGATIDPTLANYDGSTSAGGASGDAYRRRTLPVGSFPPNAWGLYDLHGNVWEWCWDWREPYPEETVLVDPRGPSEGEARVLRGGSYCNAPDRLRSARRYGAWPAVYGPNFGFRIARDVP